MAVCTFKDVFSAIPLPQWSQTTARLKNSQNSQFGGNKQRSWEARFPQCPQWENKWEDKWNPIIVKSKANSREPWATGLDTKLEETRLCWLYSLWHDLVLSLQCHCAFTALGTQLSWLGEDRFVLLCSLTSACSTGSGDSCPALSLTC